MIHIFSFIFPNHETCISVGSSNFINYLQKIFILVIRHLIILLIKYLLQ